MSVNFQAQLCPPASHVLLRVLGPATCAANGADVHVPRLQMRILAALSTRLGQWMPVSVLADFVWDEGTAPVDARRTLASHICRLRGTVGASSIEARAAAYRLSPICVETDSATFEAIATSCENFRSSRRYGEIAQMAASAMVLWRGEPFEGVDLAVPGEVQRLRALRRRTQDLYAESLLEIGAYDRAIPMLENVVAEDPVREPAWALLMRSLHASGRIADALSAYARARTALGEQLGLEPSMSLQLLEGRILRGEEVSAEPTNTPDRTFVGDRSPTLSGGASVSC